MRTLLICLCCLLPAHVLAQSSPYQGLHGGLSVMGTATDSTVVDTYGNSVNIIQQTPGSSRYWATDSTGRVTDSGYIFTPYAYEPHIPPSAPIPWSSLDRRTMPHNDGLFTASPDRGGYDSLTPR